jgi:hypothetical protein
VTASITPTITQTVTQTITPTNTPLISLVLLAPGQTPIFSYPGYTGTPIPQEAGQPISLYVRCVDEITWQDYGPATNLVGIEATPSMDIIYDTDKNLVLGKQTFSIRILRPGIYNINAIDRNNTLITASVLIPVTVTAYGNYAYTDFVKYSFDTVNKGSKNLNLMDIKIENPNPGGPLYNVLGITLTVNTDVNLAVEKVIIMEGTNILSETNWGDTKTIYCPVNNLLNYNEEKTFRIFINLRDNAKEGIFSISVDKSLDILIQKLDGAIVYIEPKQQKFPYNSDTLNITGNDLKTSFINFPNPFNPLKEKTTIQYYLPKTSKVTLVIYDIAGRKVKEIVSGENQNGRVLYKYLWDGKNSSGNLVLSGVYYIMLKIDDNEKYITKIALIK